MKCEEGNIKNNSALDCSDRDIQNEGGGERLGAREREAEKELRDSMYSEEKKQSKMQRGTKPAASAAIKWKSTTH